VAAHRGGALLWPENSLLAFGRAAELEVAYLELDVHLTRDGHAVVLHDPTLDRTTTGTGPVRERTLAEVRALRLKDRAGAVTGEPVPTLEEVAALVARTRRQLLLEIKVDDRRQRYPAIEETVLGVLDRHGLEAATVLMAFERETWRRVRALRPGMRAGALHSPRTLRAAGLDVARAVAQAREDGVAFLGLHHGLVDADAVRAAREAGLTLGAWTVNDPDALQRVVALGVNILITDRPDLGLEAARR
jgi:glycerophosphoryl diester phosphodiesterase